MANIVVNKDYTQAITFARTHNGETVTTIADSAYLTVKDKTLPTEFLLQKTLSDMTFEEGVYSVKITPSDLEDIPDGVYRYDIQTVIDGVKLTEKGTFTITSGCSTRSFLSMTRGDTKVFHFQRKDSSGEVITTAPESMKFTVKSRAGVVQFEKTLGNGITFDAITSTYYIRIDPIDTDSLQFGTYNFSIDLVHMEEPSKIAEGTLEITWESTFTTNEV